MEHTLPELMKKSNPLLAHKITVLYKLCQQRGRVVDSILNHYVDHDKPYIVKNHDHKVAEITRIDNMIFEILNTKK